MIGLILAVLMDVTCTNSEPKGGGQEYCMLVDEEGETTDLVIDKSGAVIWYLHPQSHPIVTCLPPSCVACDVVECPGADVLPAPGSRALFTYPNVPIENRNRYIDLPGCVFSKQTVSCRDEEGTPVPATCSSPEEVRSPIDSKCRPRCSGGSCVVELGSTQLLYDSTSPAQVPRPAVFTLQYMLCAYDRVRGHKVKRCDWSPISEWSVVYATEALCKAKGPQELSVNYGDWRTIEHDRLVAVDFRCLPIVVLSGSDLAGR